MSTTETMASAGKGFVGRHKWLLWIVLPGLFFVFLCALGINTVWRIHREAEQQASMDNLRKLCMAFHAHQEKHSSLPGQAIIHLETEQPLLSWRVTLLPFLGEKDLYDQIRLEEPWDSAHNRQFWNRMPAVYQLPGKTNDGMTSYQVFYGVGTMFPPDVPKRSLAGNRWVSFCPYKIHTIPDGASNTIFAVEAPEPVNWMKPADIPFQARPAGTPFDLLGDLWGNGTSRVVMCDGVARKVSHKVGPMVLQWAIQPNDGGGQSGCWCNGPGQCK